MSRYIYDSPGIDELTQEHNSQNFTKGISKCIFFKVNVCVLISLVDSNSALLQLMAWQRTGDTPLPESVTTKFYDAKWRHNWLSTDYCVNNRRQFSFLWRNEKFVLNSLAPGRIEQKFREVIFKPIQVTDGWDISCKIAFRWMPLNLTDDKSILVQVMAWCRQATSHYLSQCWPRSMLPYGVTRPQWVKCAQHWLSRENKETDKWHIIQLQKSLKWSFRFVNESPCNVIPIRTYVSPNEGLRIS